MSTPTPATDVRRSDEIRARLSALYEETKPTLAAFKQYSESAQALSIEFIKATLDETFPAVEKTEGLLIATLDAAESPKLTERKISDLKRWLSEKNATLRHVEYDQQTRKFFLFA